jgi:hypothetical protein
MKFGADLSAEAATSFHCAACLQLWMGLRLFGCSGVCLHTVFEASGAVNTFPSVFMRTPYGRALALRRVQFAGSRRLTLVQRD